MSKQAFDTLLDELDNEERANIYAAAAAFGLSFDDPSWVPFAITRITLADLKQEANNFSKAIETAANRALSKINTKAQAVSEQAQNVIETEVTALKKVRGALEALLAEGQARYQAELAKLDAEHMTALVSKSADSLAKQMSASLKAHDAELQQSRDRFSSTVETSIAHASNAARAAVGSVRHELAWMLWALLGAVGICAGIGIAGILFMQHHEATSQADLLRAYAAQRDDLLKQIDGAQQLLVKQRTGQLSLHYYGSNLYLLAPIGLGEVEHCGDHGPLPWIQPGGTPCVLLGPTKLSG